MGFGIPSFSSIAQTVGKAVGEAASKAASVVTQQQAPAAQTPAAPQKPVDSFEAAPPSKPVVCGGTDTAGAQCLPSWGKDSGGGGGPAGVNPSTK
jgi:hypothetical protein